MNFEKVGIVCLNHEIREECQNCLWWEWDSLNQRCSNCSSPVCALSRSQLFWAASCPGSSRI
jgi:hypothetical protein